MIAEPDPYYDADRFVADVEAFLKFTTAVEPETVREARAAVREARRNRRLPA